MPNFRNDQPSRPINISRRAFVATPLAGGAGAHFGATRSSSQDSSTPAENTYAQAVATTHYAATEAGVSVLQAGGTAADASVAIACALSVVEPYFSHALGGGTWAMYYDEATGEVTALDGVGPIGSLATLEDYAPRAGDAGIHQSTVPGSWDGWMLWLRDYGALSLREVLQPAIELATNGFEMSAEMGSYMNRYADAILAHEPSSRLYVAEGSFPGTGAILSNPDLAATFTALADTYESAGGDHVAGIQAARDHYYRGPIAEAIVAESDAGNGYLTLDDFANFEAEIVEPISIEYGTRYRIFQNPPNSQGITMLLALNTLTNFDHSQFTALDVETIHSQIEATKLAFGDRNSFIGDPDHVEMDVAQLLSRDHAAAQAARIDMNRAMHWPENAPETQMEPANTTTFQVSDQWGNVASVTTSIGLQFRVIGTTGIHINDRMRYLSLDPNDPNVVSAGKKVRHTSCPYLVLEDGRPYLAGGNTGADSQPQVQLQQLMSAIDFGLSAQEAISLPRWISRAWVPSTYPHEVANTLQLQPEHSADIVQGLQALGHVVEIGSVNLGNGSMIRLPDEGQTADVGVESRFSTAEGAVVD